MARDKTVSHKLIVKNAKKEFLEKGFEKASMRVIAKNSNLTVGALYRHFDTKEAMFSYLVEPVFEEFRKDCINMTELAVKALENFGVEDFHKDSIRSDFRLLEYIYKNLDEFKLMFNCSSGTKYENIRSMIIDFEVDMSRIFLNKLKQIGVPINKISDEQMRIFYSMALNPLFEVMAKEYSYEDAKAVIELMAPVLNYAWEKMVLAPA